MLKGMLGKWCRLISLAVLLGWSSLYASDPQFNTEKTTFLGTITLQVTSVSPGVSTQILYHGNPLRVLAGQYQIVSFDAPQSTAFCVDLDHWMRLKQDYTYELWLANGRAGALLALQSGFLTGNDLNRKGAGFQIAMWEIAYDHALGNGDNLNGGVFEYSANAAIKSYANSLLSSTAGQIAPYFYLRAIGEGNRRGQDLVMAVPEPATMLSLGTGLIGLLLRRRRK